MPGGADRLRRLDPRCPASRRGLAGTDGLRALILWQDGKMALL